MTSDDYRPAVMITPEGKTQRGSVRYIKLSGVASAIEKRQRNEVVFVAPEDVTAVLTAEWAPLPEWVRD